jgi:hypothetical protein
MIEFLNNPYTWVLEAAEKVSPGISAEVVFYDRLQWRKEFDHHAWGVTIFPDDGTDPLIVLRADLNLVESTEILAHELTHVIVGEKEEHNEIFELKFEELHRVYDEIANTIKVAK